MTPAEVFRDNLRRLTVAFDLDFDGLAVALGFGRDDKKWLSRAWLNGLAKSDSRSRDRLRRLTTFFGLENARDMWVPEVEPDPAQLAKAMDNRWDDLVAKVANAMRVIDRAFHRYPKEIQDLVTNHKCKVFNDVIAVWVAAKYGTNRLSDGEQQLIAQVEEDFAHALELELTTNFKSQLTARLAQHPAFNDMVVQMCRTLDLQPIEDAYDHVTGQPVEFPAAEAIPDKFYEYLHSRIYESMIRPLSFDEVYARFVRRYLASGNEEDEYDSGDMFLSVMAELQMHAEWSNHVTRAYAGDFDAAESNVRVKWKEARIKSSHTITVDAFVHFYTSNILDELVQDKETEVGDIGQTRKSLAE